MTLMIEDNTFNILGMIAFAFILARAFTEVAKMQKVKK